MRKRQPGDDAEAHLGQEIATFAEEWRGESGS
jgi:hypothetical protein